MESIVCDVKLLLYTGFTMTGGKRLVFDPETQTYTLPYFTPPRSINKLLFANFYMQLLIRACKIKNIPLIIVKHILRHSHTNEKSKICQ